MLSSNRRVLIAVVTLSLMGLMVGAAPAEPGKYIGPIDVVAAKDGKSLYVVCLDTPQIAVVDVASGKLVRGKPLPAAPTGLAQSPDGAKLYVTLGTPAGSVAVLDAASGQSVSSIAVGHTPGAPVVSPDGKRLYVCNRFNNNVSVIDLEAGKEIAKVAAVREPMAAAITPDGATLVVGNQLPLDPADSYDVAAVVTLIDTATNQPTNLRLPNGSTGVRGVAISPDGKYAYVAHILARYQMPTTQLERGWMNTNAMSIIDLAAKKPLNTVLLDDVDLGAAIPWGVATTADGAMICVTHAATHELAVIDAQAMLDKVLKMPADLQAAQAAGLKYDGSYSSVVAADVPNDLAFLVGLKRRIGLRGTSPWSYVLPQEGPMVNGPRGLAVIGTKAYVAVYFSDLVAVVDLAPKPEKLVSYLPLGPEPQLTVARKGEMFFSDADLCFQHWQSCTSCHPDARVDALNWDLMNDGMGTPKNNRSMLLVHKTPPAMSEGVRATAEEAVRSGITHIQFAVRPEEDAVAIDEYLKTLQPVPSPHLVGGQLSEAAQRGKALFFSERVGCFKCHPEPLYTDLQMHDVASRGQYDRRSEFDTPTLIECWRTAPYMHDGHFTTVEDLIRQGKHGQKMGDVAGLSDQEVKDLAEFVLSL